MEVRSQSSSDGSSSSQSSGNNVEDDNQMGNGQVYWQCLDCEERYYKSKGSCPDCGGNVVSQHKGKGDNFTGFFRQMSIPQIIGYVLGISGLFMLTVVVTAYFF